MTEPEGKPAEPTEPAVLDTHYETLEDVPEALRPWAIKDPETGKTKLNLNPHVVDRMKARHKDQMTAAGTRHEAETKIHTDKIAALETELADLKKAPPAKDSKSDDEIDHLLEQKFGERLSTIEGALETEKTARQAAEQELSEFKQKTTIESIKAIVGPAALEAGVVKTALPDVLRDAAEYWTGVDRSGESPRVEKVGEDGLKAVHEDASEVNLDSWLSRMKISSPHRFGKVNGAGSKNDGGDGGGDGPGLGMSHPKLQGIPKYTSQMSEAQAAKVISVLGREGYLALPEQPPAAT